MDKGELDLETLVQARGDDGGIERRSAQGMRAVPGTPGAIRGHAIKV
jgi:hypothetical protein